MINILESIKFYIQDLLTKEYIEGYTVDDITKNIIYIIDLEIKKLQDKTTFERIKEERDKLTMQLGQMTAFIENKSQFSKISTIQQDLLIKQRRAMEIYRNILEKRLKVLPRKKKKN